MIWLATKTAFENPLVVCFVIALPSILIAYLGYQESGKADALAELKAELEDLDDD